MVCDLVIDSDAVRLIWSFIMLAMSISSCYINLNNECILSHVGTVTATPGEQLVKTSGDFRGEIRRGEAIQVGNNVVHPALVFC